MEVLSNILSNLTSSLEVHRDAATNFMWFVLTLTIPYSEAGNDNFVYSYEKFHAHYSMLSTDLKRKHYKASNLARTPVLVKVIGILGHQLIFKSIGIAF